jgi:hypothetical protein
LVNTQFPNFVILDQLDGNWLAIYWLILSWLSEFHYLLIRQWSWHLLDIYVILFIVIMWDNRFQVPLSLDSSMIMALARYICHSLYCNYVR